MENKEMHELIEAVITALGLDGTFIFANRVEIEAELHSLSLAQMPAYVYYNKSTETNTVKENGNTIEATNFELSCLYLHTFDLTPAQRDTLQQTAKANLQLIMNNLSLSPNIVYGEDQDMVFQLDKLEFTHNKLCVGALVRMNGMPLWKLINFCV